MEATWTDITQAIAAIVTAAVAVPGVIFGLRQIKNLDDQVENLEDSVRSAARASIYDTARGVKQAFVAHPELRRYVLGPEPLPSDHADRERATALADYVCLYLEEIVTQSHTLPENTRGAWLAYVRGVYENSPCIRSYLEDKNRKKWYSDEFWEIVQDDAVR
jgi:hypothetical protein